MHTFVVRISPHVLWEWLLSRSCALVHLHSGTLATPAPQTTGRAAFAEVQVLHHDYNVH